MPRRILRDLSIIQIPPNSEETNSDQQTAIGSLNIPNTVDEPVKIQKRVKVSRNSHGHPIGLEAQVLAGYLCIIARNANLLPINYESWHHMPDSNKNHAQDNIKYGQKVRCLQLFDITHRKKDGSSMTTEVAETMKLNNKRVKYEAMASSDSSVNLDDIDNRVITEVLGPERYGQVRFQGSFVSPTQYFGSSSQQYMPLANQAQAEVQRLRDQIAQM
ncbi:hypothetical protein GOBAR_AA36865 [Gossypium barbadense]|uniref:Transposase Tnp1/En/Spm-like domain-containing protein n=1 Tax=Gossypium barbadense TaxID=3634 RepID=A0A2P5VYF4_GOSBA|nr:hypothetical protein GOBAR_AA36865 [Gossypium barbadense]